MSKAWRDRQRDLENGKARPEKPERPGFRSPKAIKAKPEKKPAPTVTVHTNGITSAMVAEIAKAFRIPPGILGGRTVGKSATLTAYMTGLDLARPKPAIEPSVINRLKVAHPRTVTPPIPDAITPIVAWRAWCVTPEGGQWRLAALGRETVWEPKKAIAANCRKSFVAWDGNVNGDHRAPHKDCSCGIWSFRTLEELITALENYQGVKVFGQVSIWGRIIECENGFRSQYAYPKELWLVDESLEELGYIYGVPVRTVSK